MATELTRENCETANMFFHKEAKDARGNRFSCRRNGKTQIWKTRPDEFKIPVKRGLYSYDYLTHKNCNNWTID